MLGSFRVDVTQSVEFRPNKPVVGGSTPLVGFIFFFVREPIRGHSVLASGIVGSFRPRTPFSSAHVAQLVESSLGKRAVTGSNPVMGSTPSGFAMYRGACFFLLQCIRMSEDELKILTVADFLGLVNQTLALIPSEQVRVVGEISDYRVSQGKWINFALKDEEAEAKVACFATVYNVTAPLEDGMRVQIQGYPKVYERFGKFSLNVQSIELVGEGALAKAYAALKKKLEAEGLFEADRKRVIPRFPECIGLITSREAAAYGDFLQILNNRWGGVEVMHAPVHVQGQHAVREILGAFEAFERLDSSKRPDVLVLTRGGGSLEDLHAFNDEQVARAVFKSSIPVVVGVGHERDESLCDFASDVRASTPSNAAERIVPDRREVLREIEHSTERMADQIEMTLTRRQQRIDHAANVLARFIDAKVYDLRATLQKFGHAFDRFRLSLVSTRQYIERNEHIVRQSFLTTFSRMKDRTTSTIRLFESFNLKRTLDRGFSIVRSGEKIIRDASRLARGQEIHVQLATGEFDADVK